MRADETREGMVIDLSPVAEEWGEMHDPRVDDFEYALILDDAEPAEPVGKVPAVLIYTDQGNYKVPADFDVPFINYDGAPQTETENA